MLNNAIFLALYDLSLYIIKFKFKFKFKFK